MTQILITGFASGYQNKAAHEQMKNDALFYMRDLTIDSLGELTCRRLCDYKTEFVDTTAATAPRDIYQLDVEGVNKYLIFYRIGTTLYCYNSSTNATRTVSAAMSGSRVTYAAIKPNLSEVTYVYATDGTTMLSDNGSSSISWGIDPPEGAAFVAAGSITGGLSAGAYKYVYTFYDGVTGIESDISPVTASITATASSSINVTNIEISPNSRVTSRRVYRTIANGGYYYLVAIIPDNTATGFIDTVADSALSTQAITDQGVPRTCSLVHRYREMLMLSGDVNYPNRVYFSLSRKPDNFPSTYYLDVGSADDSVLAFVEWEGKIYFMQSAGISGLEGTSADTFVVYDTRSLTGTAAGATAVPGIDGIYFLGYDGVYRFDGAKSLKVSDAIDRCFGLTPTSLWDVVDYSQVPEYAKGQFFQGKYWIILPMKNTAGTTTNYLWEYDIVDKRWQMHELAVQDIFADPGRGELYGSMRRYGLATYTIYNLLQYAASDYDAPEPRAVTKAFSLMGDVGGTGQQGEGKYESTTGWVRRFRVDALGTWDLTFYVDGRNIGTRTITNSTAADRYKWYGFPSKIKGSYIYVDISNDTGRPDSTIFRALEIR